MRARVIFAIFGIAAGSVQAQDRTFPIDETTFRARMAETLNKIGNFKADCPADPAGAINRVCVYSFNASTSILLAQRLPDGKPHEISVFCGKDMDALNACAAIVAITAESSRFGLSTVQMSATLRASFIALAQVSDVRFVSRGRKLVGQNVGGRLMFHLQFEP